MTKPPRVAVVTETPETVTKPLPETVPLDLFSAPVSGNVVPIRETRGTRPEPPPRRNPK